MLSWEKTGWIALRRCWTKIRGLLSISSGIIERSAIMLIRLLRRRLKRGRVRCKNWKIRMMRFKPLFLLLINIWRTLGNIMNIWNFLTRFHLRIIRKRRKLDCRLREKRGNREPNYQGLRVLHLRSPISQMLRFTVLLNLKTLSTIQMMNLNVISKIQMICLNYLKI